VGAELTVEPEELADLRQALAERVARDFGEERATADRDAINFMAQSLQRVYRLDIEVFAATEPDPE
jgi:hypothetical protein